LLKQRLDFQVRKSTESMDRFAIIQGQKIVEATVGFSSKKTIESMLNVAIIQGQ